MSAPNMKIERHLHNKPEWIKHAVRAVPNEHMAQPVLKYLTYGYHPGHFLHSVLNNEFQQAAMHADGLNKTRLHEWGMWLYNDVPAVVWGSPEKTRIWMQEMARGYEVGE